MNAATHAIYVELEVEVAIDEFACLERWTRPMRGNKSRYDGEAFLDSLSKLHREENCNATWSLQIGELVRLSHSRDYGSGCCELRPGASPTH